jgi:2-polyprenyl-6-methoxyphenol hydroxylase-like FAD-dependent oxidoreductase
MAALDLVQRHHPHADPLHGGARGVKIAIAGAGIGGLAAALALHADGHEVEVYEAVAEILPLGVGINLLPQAAIVLGELGVVDDLLAEGVATRDLGYYNRFGQHIWTEPRGLFGGYGAPQISLARGALQMTLLRHAEARLGRECLHYGQRLQGFETRDGRAIARFVSGATVEADVLICADGIHSAARRQLYPDEGPPPWSGRILWRATSFARPYMSGASMIMAGHADQKFVCYPIEPVRPDGLQRINWIAELRRDHMPAREDWNRAGNPDDFLPAFADWQFGWLDVPELIRRAERIYEFPMVDRDPVERWTEGRVTLLGDAAHAMYPIGSNGASQAILDARALATALRTQADPVAALKAYEAERLPPTAAIVRANRGNGPEQCMQLAHERAPGGFADASEVFAPGELAEMALRYKQLTGMKQAERAA